MAQERSMPNLHALALALALIAPPTTTHQAQPGDSPEAAVRALYERVTWKGGETADWAKVREVFRPEAVFALRLDRGELRMLDLDGFIDEFVKFAELDAVKKHGFQEKILKLKATQYGDIANVYVLYEASLPGHPMTPQQGIDICNLVKRDGKWSILSIVNEAIAKDTPLPAPLSE